MPVSLTPVNTGGAVVTWAIAPALPAGLNFNTATGQITGTPSAIAAAQSFTIAATNTGGTGSVALNLSVVQTPPSIAYASGSYAFYVGTAITTLVPANTGGPVVTWAINPALPAGLDFDTANGRISGTPTAVAAAQNYTVSATNLGGTSTASPSISVAVHAPVITVQPYGQILSPGAIPSFSVTATGTGALGYQWYRDGVAIDGAADSSYTAPAFAVEDDRAVFTVVVSDSFGGSTTSDPAVLSLFQDLTSWLDRAPGDRRRDQVAVPAGGRQCLPSPGRNGQDRVDGLERRPEGRPQPGVPRRGRLVHPGSAAGDDDSPAGRR